MAGFEVFMYGRFWVFTEGQNGELKLLRISYGRGANPSACSVGLSDDAAEKGNAA